MGLIRIPHMMDPGLASGFRYKWDSLRRREHSLRNIAYFCAWVTIENSCQCWYQFLLPSLIQGNFEGIFTFDNLEPLHLRCQHFKERSFCHATFREPYLLYFSVDVAVCFFCRTFYFSGGWVEKTILPFLGGFFSQQYKHVNFIPKGAIHIR